MSVLALRLAILLLTLSGAAHIIAGLVRDERRRNQRAQSDAALAILSSGLVGDFETNDVPTGLRVKSSSDRRALLGVIRSLPLDLDGQMIHGLRAILGQRGMERSVRRLAASRRWKRRAEAADLQFLVAENVVTNGGQQLSVHQLRLRLLEDSDPTVRTRALQGLTPMQCRRSADTIVPLLVDPNAEVRRAALDAAATAGSATVVPTVRLLENTGPEMAEALRLCALVPDSRFVSVLLRHAGADDPHNRALAARALGNAPIDSAAPILNELLVDAEPSVRAAAAAALASLGHASSAPAIAGRLGDPNWLVREAAGAALVHLGPAGELFLRRGLADPDPFARDMAGRMLSEHISQATEQPTTDHPLFDSRNATAALVGAGASS